MKIVKRNLLGAVIIIGIFIGCKKQEESQTPASNTDCKDCNFFATIGSSSFKSKASIEMGTNMAIVAFEYKTFSPGLTIQVLQDSLKVGEYIFGSINDFASNAGKYCYGSHSSGSPSNGNYKLYETDSLSKKAMNRLTITKYDITNKKISGTFNFQAYDKDSTDKVSITSGTFTDITW